MHELKDLIMNTILNFLDNLPPEWIVLIMSCFPIIELRGSIPLAMGAYEMPFWKALTLGVIGNMLPILPLLLLFQPMSTYLRRFTLYDRFYQWLYNRTVKKGSQIERLGALGLVIFVAIPLPVTGAWTASFAAIIFNIRTSYAFFSIFLGVIIAGLIMGAFSFSIFG